MRNRLLSEKTVLDAAVAIVTALLALLWIIARLILLLAWSIFTRSLPHPSSVMRIVAGSSRPPTGGRTDMSNTEGTEVVRAPRTTLFGIVEQVNRKGLKVDGHWYDYGTLFKRNKGVPLGQEDVKKHDELQLVTSARKQKSFIEAIVSVGGAAAAASSGEQAAQAAEPAKTAPEDSSPPAGQEAQGFRRATPNQLAKAEELALESLTTAEYAQIVQIRFKRPIKDLEPWMASRTITFMGNGPVPFKGGRYQSR